MTSLSRAASGQKSRGGGQGIQYLVSLQWPVVQLDFSDGMHMTENSYMPQSARMRAQIQANTGNFGRQRFSLHGVDLTKIDGGGARERKDHPSILIPLGRIRILASTPTHGVGPGELSWTYFSDLAQANKLRSI